MQNIYREAYSLLILRLSNVCVGDYIYIHVRTIAPPNHICEPTPLDVLDLFLRFSGFCSPCLLTAYSYQ